ncbi:MAG: nitrite reductase large subunit NirB [Candidatus Nanopelagicales bacterium]|nr:nitrite reductase large subunit NirB [Candidatus Nanopelagicales bacterium]MDZ4250701.1 nitrite reductase large subunit NirB [Candidatus Nanopelagicales bacterium]
MIGGGLLGLEAAGALLALGLRVTVIEFAERLMATQVDAGGGEALRRLITALGVEIRTGVAADRIDSNSRGRVRSVTLSDGTSLPAGVVIFATGVRPRDDVARNSGLRIGERGGIVIDSACRTSDPSIYAVGECASWQQQCFGLLAPANTMAEVAVDQMLGGHNELDEIDTSTKLKLVGVDVASFGDAFAEVHGSLEVVLADPVAGIYRKLVLSDDAQNLLGGILVGNANDYAVLRAQVGAKLTASPIELVTGSADVDGALGDSAIICTCHNVSAGQLRQAVRDGHHDLAALKASTRAGTGCGSCLPLAKRILNNEMEAAGLTVSRAMCEHFAMPRAELFDMVRIHGHATFTEIITMHGTGRGCDICKPVCASILSSLGRGHVLDGENAALQDTNDFVMANIQKDGTYSVVPRIPGGEITPAKLRVIADVAAQFDLYTKITGGQRIDVFGARIEQLPLIWKRLVDSGFESGHAYGKAVRTVKSCVGSTWCRFGIRDSAGMATALELRYRGLRAPHKVKLAVSGCARECAEARSKDVGVIASDRGWNLYVCGNGGNTPRHAQLLAEDLDDETLVRLIDRFLMFYVRTADRLQRTAAWLEDLDGGIHYLRRVIIDDTSGVCADLEAAMMQHVDTYVDEWRATLADPHKLAFFTSFINEPDTPDPDLRYALRRQQKHPAEA